MWATFRLFTVNRKICAGVSNLNACPLTRLLTYTVPSSMKFYQSCNQLHLTFSKLSIDVFNCVLTPLLTAESVICLCTLSLFCPCLAMASYLTFPSASTCTARALDVFFFLPISRGNWATWISGKAPPSPKSYRNTDFNKNINNKMDWLVLHSSMATVKCGTSKEEWHQTNEKSRPNRFMFKNKYVTNGFTSSERGTQPFLCP